ncbi:MAG TPA: hypothetical protein VIJ09_08740 [Acidimicrobiales bacterium]|jgi:hypothetical protein
MPTPTADIVGHMNESLSGMRKVIEDIDFADLTPEEAARLYRFFDAAESVAVAGRTLVLPVVDRAASRR